ncbi:hypothetical protein [uncultured Brachyspira sp.]|uniref:hypothetical protein n=1 Tax=uncultured Brachyspira sp. TaxID=221953 RepID=UPI002607B9B3|nr:hypothetical protein [uncultured Brachyspira sp.]
MYEQISQDTIKELLKIWKVKNIEELKNKSSNISLVSFKFYNLSKESKNIILYILKNEAKELNSIDIAYSLKYTQKQIPMFFNSVDEIKKSGLLYLKIKRRRLNSHDDTLYFLPEVKPIIENIILKDSIKITNYIDESYSANVYKKYLQKIINIYENGGILEYSKTKINDDELLALCKANIVSVYFDNDFLVYIGINNSKVLENLEKTLKESIDSSIFIYNHFNILNDIETFIYECDVQKLTINDIDIKFLTNNLEASAIFNICLKLSLIKADTKGYISLEYDNIKKYLLNSIEERMELVSKNIYKNYSDYFKKISKILENGGISKSALYIKLKDEFNISISAEMYNNIIFSMFVLGIIEVSFYENAILAVRNFKNNAADNNKKCFINGNFEISLINHYLFNNDFIYMCNLYFDIDKQETVYTYTMTEESILRGKTIISDNSSKYHFENFLEILKSVLEDNNVEMPKHIETSIRRWYDRGIISSVYDNVTLVIIKDSNKLEEIIHEAKRKGILMTKINDEYAIIKSSSVTKKNLTKFLRQRKIIVTF